MRVAVIGNGRVGTVISAALAWLGHEVVGLEADEAAVAALSEGAPGFAEPNLPEMLTGGVAAGRLRFTTDPSEALRGTPIAFLCVGTPQGDDGAADLSQVDAAVDAICRHFEDGLVIAIKSTLPVGTGDRIERRIAASPRAAGRTFAVVSNPEFMSEGRSVADFLTPDRVVLGGDAAAVARVASLERPILEQTFPGGDPRRRPELCVTDRRSAEMIKYASNAFLATKVSFANEIAAASEVLGADARAVLPAVGADRRIGRAFLGHGLGWGGSCLPKDVSALLSMASGAGRRMPMLSAAVSINDAQADRAARRLLGALGELSGKRIGILGVAFKPGIDDARTSPSLALAARLIAAGADVVACDPGVQTLPDGAPALELVASLDDCVAGADAVVIGTPWPEYIAADLAAIRSRMRGDLLFDARNVIDPARARAADLRLVRLGYGSDPGAPETIDLAGARNGNGHAPTGDAWGLWPQGPGGRVEADPRGLVSIVVPCKDEAATLEALRDAVAAALEGRRFEIVYVDDGSTDVTPDVLRRMARDDRRVRSIRFDANRGKAAALAAGFAAARGAAVVTIDADLQDDPAEIPRLLAKLDEGYGVVSGWKQRRRDRWTRRVASRIFNWGTRRVSGLALHDFNCGLKAYSAAAAADLAEMSRGEQHRYLPVLAAARGHRVTEIAVNHRPRARGRSRYGLERYARAALDLITASFLTRYATRPLHLLGGAAFVALAAAAGTGAYAAVGALQGRTVGTWAIAALVLAGMAVVLIAAGLVAEAVVANAPRARAPAADQAEAAFGIVRAQRIEQTHARGR